MIGKGRPIRGREEWTVHASAIVRIVNLLPRWVSVRVTKTPSRLQPRV